MKIEIHLLQNFAPSCLNRDDTGAPKQCEFGGFTRARISSQCSKRAVRQQFQADGSVEVGTRTKRLKEELTKRLNVAGRQEEELSHALDLFLEACYSKMDSRDSGDTAVLLYLAEPEIEVAAQAVNENWETLSTLARQRLEILADTRKKEADRKKAAAGVRFKADKSLLERLRTAGLCADVALFGRMLAEQPEMNVDAACQVAHPLSTHLVSYEMDFYTAVDDLLPEGATGAGMMGHAGFNSACYYRYALIDRNQLIANLKDAALADTVIQAFLEAFVLAVPTGKQNSMAAHNPPDFGMFVVRDKGVPISLANAFAAPVQVRADEEDERKADLMGQSIERLADYWDAVKRVYGSRGILKKAVFQTRYADRLKSLAGSDAGSLEKAIACVMQTVRGAAEPAAEVLA